MTAAVERAGEIARGKGYFQPMQFDNPTNPEVHRRTTARGSSGVIVRKNGKKVHLTLEPTKDLPADGGGES